MWYVDIISMICSLELLYVQIPLIYFVAIRMNNNDEDQLMIERKYFLKLCILGEKLTNRTQGLRESRVLNMICGIRTCECSKPCRLAIIGYGIGG